MTKSKENLHMLHNLVQSMGRKNNPDPAQEAEIKKKKKETNPIAIIILFNKINK